MICFDNLDMIYTMSNDSTKLNLCRCGFKPIIPFGISLHMLAHNIYIRKFIRCLIMSYKNIRWNVLYDSFIAVE